MICSTEVAYIQAGRQGLFLLGSLPLPRPHPLPACAPSIVHSAHHPQNDVHNRIQAQNAGSAYCSATEDAAGRCFGGFARIATVIETARAKDPGEVKRKVWNERRRVWNDRMVSVGEGQEWNGAGEGAGAEKRGAGLDAGKRGGAQAGVEWGSRRLAEPGHCQLASNPCIAMKGE